MEKEEAAIRRMVAEKMPKAPSPLRATNIWAILSDEYGLVLGDGIEGWNDQLLVGEQAELEKVLDSMPHGRAKKLRLVELIPRPLLPQIR